MKADNIVKLIIFVSFICLFLLSGVLSFAAATTKSPEASLKRLFPKLQFKSIQKTDFDGLYEVLNGDRIIYFYPKKGYLFLGEIIDHEGRNITRERISEERYKLISAADLKSAIKIGNGKNVVVEITDPDCPFCRKMHAYWSTRKDITRYVFLKPLDMHPDALKKVKYILASSDREKALFEAYCGSLDNKREVLDKDYNDKGLLEAQKTVVDKLHVPGTPSYWINGRFVNGANINLIEQIIGKTGNYVSGAQDSNISNCR